MNITERDLMVGDWVYRVDFKEPIPVRILGLEVVNYDTHPKQYVADVFCPKHNNNVGLYMDEICPIPLTSEILEKNRFGKTLDEDDIECYRHYNRAADGYIKITLYDGGDGDWSLEIVNYDKFNDNEIRYKNEFSFLKVHELQHALRLAGIDYVQLEDSDILYKAEVMEFDVPLSESELYEQRGLESRLQDYWQDVRERAAIAAMQGIITLLGSSDRGAFRDVVVEGYRGEEKTYPKEIAEFSVACADALIEELKKK